MVCKPHHWRLLNELGCMSLKASHNRKDPLYRAIVFPSSRFLILPKMNSPLMNITYNVWKCLSSVVSAVPRLYFQLLEDSYSTHGAQLLAFVQKASVCFA